MIELPDVTLYAFTSIEFDDTIRSLMISSSNIKFGAVKLISDHKPENLPHNIQWEYAPKINNIDDFNYYMFLEMGKHILTSHALYVQHHAFVINYDTWDNNWLSFDFLGAPWAIVENTYMANDGTRSRVGNDGFSLKSKKLLDIPKQQGWYLREEQGWKNVDGQICCYWRKELNDLGIKYAPVEVAAKFSYERDVPENINIKRFFGFHRNYPVR